MARSSLVLDWGLDSLFRRRRRMSSENGNWRRRLAALGAFGTDRWSLSIPSLVSHVPIVLLFMLVFVLSVTNKTTGKTCNNEL